MKFGHWLTLLGTASALVLLWSLRDVLIHVFAAIVLAVAAAEAAVCLGIILALYRNKDTINIDEMNIMRS